MEEFPLPRHAARHDVYNFHHVLTSKHVERLERDEVMCSLPRHSCYKMAVKEGNWHIVKLHLKETPEVVNMATDIGVTALMQFGNNPEHVCYLLNLGADVNAQDCLQGDSVLMHFVKHTVKPESVKMLLEAGANVHIRDRDDKHVIMHAASSLYNIHKMSRNKYSNDVRVVGMLLAAGVSVQDLGTETVPVFMIALYNPDDNMELIKTLIDAGTDVNCVDEHSSETALMRAVRFSRSSSCVVRMLIDAGSNVNAKDIFNSALMLAVLSKHEVSLELVKLLVDEGANINVEDLNKSSILMLAVSNKNTDIASVLISSGAEVNHSNACGVTALMLSGNDTVVKMLIEAGANVNAKDHAGDCVLMHAIRNHEITAESVKYLIEAGANILAENKDKEIVLTRAIKSFRSAENKEELLLIIQHLLDHPASSANDELQPDNHPQRILLNFKLIKRSISYLRKTKTRVDNEILPLYKLILNSHFKNTSMQENVNLQYSYIDESRNVLLNSITIFMYNQYFDINYVALLQACVQQFLDAGFDMREGISPITMFILRFSGEGGDIFITDTQPLESDVNEPSPHSKFIDFLITHGAHVTQQLLPLNDNTNVALREQLYLPDVLYIALFHSHVRTVRQLLPFWGFPPLYGLLFTPYCKEMKYVFLDMFAVLAEHGGIPHGTEMFNNVTRLVEDLKPPWRDVFRDMQSSPLSLRELCRYQLRASLAPLASRAGHSLPQMIAELSPPGLKDFLLMQPPADLGLLVCDDARLMQVLRSS